MSDPISQSYLQSDTLGRFIFLLLGLLSVISWGLILWRWRLMREAERADRAFQRAFELGKQRVLQLELLSSTHAGPMQQVYQQLRHHTLEILAKNRQLGAIDSQTQGSYLTIDDIEMICQTVQAQVESQLYSLEKQLPHLSTIAALAPLLGLLGTVWGILISLNAMSSSSGQTILAGLSLALATTVVGLLVAIPALLGYNGMRNWLKQFEAALSTFSMQALTIVELQYRKVERP